MTSKNEIMLEKVKKSRVIAIVRGFTRDICLKLAESYLKGGITMMEMPLEQTSPESWKETAATIRAIRERFGESMTVGAGTILDEGQLAIVANEGAEFIVTPNIEQSVILGCRRLSLPVMAGAFTPSEVVAAYAMGANFVKIFPAGQLGPGYIKAISAPLSHIPFLAFGGIDAENVRSYISAGCVGVGVGGAIVNRDLIARGDFAAIAEAAAKLNFNAAIA